MAAIGLTSGNGLLAAGGVAAVIAPAGGLAAVLLANERRRHEAAEETLSAQASSLELLLDSIGRIAAVRDGDTIVEQTRLEAERLFHARATVVKPGAAEDGAIVVLLRVRDEELGAIRLEREQPFSRGDIVRATVLGDFAARATENARLLAEATVRETERALLSDRLITAEQDERRRLALFLHDGAVQSLAGIGLMLEAASHSVGEGRVEEGTKVLGSALERHRQTIRSLRDLSFNLEPVVLRDQGFAPAVAALADQLGISHGIQFDLDVAASEELAEKAQVALYQTIRETLDLAMRRGPPSRVSISVRTGEDDSIVVVIADDGAGERRRSSFDAIAERARTINGTLHVEAGSDGGTAVRIVLPPYVARR